jgi:hypothetical protein
VSVAPSVSPLLAPFYALAACDAAFDLAEWMIETMSEAIMVPESSRPIPLQVATGEVPLLLDTRASCADAVAFDGNVVGWQLRDASGELVARAVSRPANDEPIDDIDWDARTAAGDEYHQDWMGSGQTFTGWVTDGRIEARTNLAAEGSPSDFRAFVIDIPGYVIPEEGRAEGSAASPLVQRIMLTDMAPLPWYEVTGQPDELPPGFGRCSGGVVWMGKIPGVDANGSITQYCNPEGESIWVGRYDQYNIPQPAPDAEEILQVAGSVFTGGQLPTGDWLAVGEVPNRASWLAVLAPPSVGLEGVTRIVASVPLLDPRAFNPADGHNNLRPLFGEEWATETLEAAGAINIGPSESILARSGRLDPSTHVELVFELPGSSPIGVEAGFFLYSDPGMGGMGDFTGIRTIGDVDVFVKQVQPDLATSQAAAFCGGIGLNFRITFVDEDGAADGFQAADDPVLTALIGMLDHLEC